MKKFLIPITTVLALFALAGTAQAKAPGTIKTYGNVELGATGLRVSFGQLFSPQDSCAANRAYKLTSKSGKKTKTLDSGRTTADGAISGFYDSNDLASDNVRFVAAKTKKCAATSASGAPQLEKSRSARKAVGTGVAILDVDGIKADGAVAGVISLNKRAKCFAGRKTTLIADGKTIDHGKTTHNGSFALHLTEVEFGATKLQVRVARGKTPDGEKCGPASATVAREMRPAF